MRNVLGGKPGPAKGKKFVVEARPLGLRSGTSDSLKLERSIDPAGFNKLADELEVEAFLKQISGANRR